MDADEVQADILSTAEYFTRDGLRNWAEMLKNGRSEHWSYWNSGRDGRIEAIERELANVLPATPTE
jgi:hypothetical protein